ncbi:MULTISPECIES: sensor histidine kinase [Gordonibacter]|nr:MULTISPECIES: HAMP domain-containing sensor histidine kinase [Gordonibacter]MDN4471242.1 HAMP domain-containing histidine kinase [Gordonibacter sp. RACS_AR68]
MTAASREGARIARRLVGIAASATLALALAALAATALLAGDGPAAEMRAQTVELNAARAELPEGADVEAADAALSRAQDALRAAADARGGLPVALVWALAALGAAFAWGVVAYLYVGVVRPFMRLEAFAQDVATGNLDAPLAYERSNPFGRFTWAFDNMRAEIKRARAAEAEAVERGKTAVAALSHDIKTPIASIRAYSEALELGLARTQAEREGYARTIARKCDEVTSLTDDLFLHALADLDRIQVRCEEAPIARVVARAVADFDAGGRVTLGRLDEAQASCDPKRLEQAIGNLLANAAKYAPGADVEVEGVLDTAARAYRVRVRDRGPGIPPEDLPFVADRFYRGSNAGDAPGAGLGLFIVRYLVEQMGGGLSLENAEPGLAAVLELPLAS